jgi:LacI family transcriptional regulator
LGRVTGQDVARKAGVSVATVSLALSGRYQDGHRVSAATRERVLTIAADLGYTPNHVARSLRQRKTTILAMLVPRLGNPYYTDIVGGGQVAALERGYAVTVMPAPDRDTRAHAVRLLGGGIVDGVIVAHHANELVDELRHLRAQGVQTVVVQGRSPDPRIPAIRVDTEESAYVATRHLISLGHRRIAHLTVLGGVSGQPATPRSDRLSGYRRALVEGGATPDNRLVVIGGFRANTMEAGAATAAELLRRPGPRPTAIFTYNDLVAVGAMRTLAKAGIRVPEDMSVVGHDGIPMGAFTSPALTTVAHHTAELGRLAVAMLCDLLDGRSPDQVERLLPTELVVRESSGPPPAGAAEAR